MTRAEQISRHAADLCLGYSRSEAIIGLGLALARVIHAEALNSANGCALVDGMAKNMKEWLQREMVQ